MFEQIRPFMKQIVVIGFVVLISFSFVIFGMQNIFAANPNLVAVVGDEKVNAFDLKRRFEFLINVQRRDNPAYSREDAINDNLGQFALQQLISRAVYQSLAKDMNVGVGNQSIINNWKETKAFQNPITGEFDPDTFEQALASSNFTEKQYTDAVRTDLIVSRFTSIETTKIPAPQGLARLMARGHLETVDFDYVTLDRDLLELPELSQPNETDLKAHHQKTASQHTVSEKRRFSVAIVTQADFEHEIDVSEEQISALYEARAAQYNKPERKSFKTVTVPNEELSNQLIEKLIQGTDIDIAAKDLGLPDPFFHENQQKSDIFDQALAESVFSSQKLEIGQHFVTNESGFGRLVGVIADVMAEDVTRLDDVKDELRKEISEGLVREKMSKAVNTILKSEGRGYPLPDAANQGNVPTIAIGFVNAQGYDESNRTPRFLLGQQKILAQVFTLEIEEVSDPVELNNNQYAFVRLDGIEESYVKPFEEVKEAVIQSWQEEEEARNLKIVVDALYDQVQKDGLASIAHLSKEGVTSITDMNRNNRPKNPFPPDLLESIHNAGADSYVKALSKAPDEQGWTIEQDWTIAYVKAKKDGDSREIEQMSISILPLLADRLQQDVFEIYQASLYETYPSKVNDSAFERALAINQ